MPAFPSMTGLARSSTYSTRKPPPDGLRCAPSVVGFLAHSGRNPGYARVFPKSSKFVDNFPWRCVDNPNVTLQTAPMITQPRFSWCAVCGAMFFCTRRSGRYCGPACRARAFRERRGARARFTPQQRRERSVGRIDCRLPADPPVDGR